MYPELEKQEIPLTDGSNLFSNFGVSLGLIKVLDYVKPLDINIRWPPDTHMYACV